MTNELVVLLAIVLFIALMLMEVPIFLSLVASGGVGIVMLRNVEQATAAIGNMTYTPIANYSQSIIPMYILLGMFALHAHLSTRLFALASSALRWLPGGLGVATVAACAAFAAVSGSSVATAASIGKISHEQMKRFGYTGALATGIVAAAGTLGILIPPSVALVLYGIVTGESIGQLLLAGIIPGLVLALFFAIYVVGVSVVQQRRASAVPALERQPSERVLVAAGRIGENLAAHADISGEGLPPEEDFADKPTRFQQGRSVIWLLALMAAVVMGIFSGIFTVIESAAVAAVLALIMLLSENARSGVRAVWDRFQGSATEASGITSMALSLFVGASVFSMFLVMTRTPLRLTEWVTGLDVAPVVIILAVILILLPLGMFLDAYSLIIVVAPLLYPPVVALGYDGVWFGILFVVMLEIALITPPVGMNVFVVSSATKESVATVFRGAAPFVAVCLVFAGLLIVFPDLALWLPETLAVQE